MVFSSSASAALTSLNLYKIGLNYGRLVRGSFTVPVSL